MWKAHIPLRLKIWVTVDNCLQPQQQNLLSRTRRKTKSAEPQFYGNLRPLILTYFFFLFLGIMCVGCLIFILSSIFNFFLRYVLLVQFKWSISNGKFEADASNCTKVFEWKCEKWVEKLVDECHCCFNMPTYIKS